MLALLLIPFIVLVEIIIYKRISLSISNCYYIKHPKLINNIIFFAFFYGIVFMLLAVILPSEFTLKRYICKLSYFWLGLILYIFISLLITFILKKIFKLLLKEKYNFNLANVLTLLFVTIFSIVMCTYGSIHAHKIVVKNYELEVNKESVLDELNVVLIADLHLGYNTDLDEVEDMVDKINDLKPDVVLVAGDIFDNEFEAIKDPDSIKNILRNINSKYGTYCCLGNHDIDEKILLGFTFSKKEEACADDKMIDFINSCNINILYDDYCKIEDIYIYGRPDKEKPNLHNCDRLSCLDLINKMDINKPIIVLEHEPIDAKELSKLGCDIYLNGHTHKGQLWPGTLTIDLFWDNAYGYKQYNQMHNIVTSGVGLFGPDMRIDSNAEICNIKIKYLSYDK